jgi:hypothetical protein
LPPTGPDDLALLAVTTNAFGGKLRAFDAKTAGGDPLDGAAAGFVTGSAKAVVFR